MKMYLKNKSDIEAQEATFRNWESVYGTIENTKNKKK